MDKFVYITDTHFRTKPPRNRTDDFVVSLLKKLEWVIKFCKKKKCVHLLHGGDLFDSPKIDDKIAGTVAKMFARSGLQVYFILGNHDVIGKNETSYIHGRIHMFESYPWFHMIGGQHVEFKYSSITGLNYASDLECPSFVKMPDTPVGKVTIAMLHSMVTDERMIIEHGKARTIRCSAITVPNASIILTGHFHPGYLPRENVFGQVWCNPGAFVRKNASEARQNVGPGLLYIRVSKGQNYRLKHYKIPCRDDVFNIEDIANTVSSKEEREKFVNAFHELQAADMFKGNVLKTLDQLVKNVPDSLQGVINEEVVNLCRTKIREASDGV